MGPIAESDRRTYIQNVSKSVSWILLIAAGTIVIVLSAVRPNVLSDSNVFLHGFVGEGLLDVLGVILAITLASAGQLHLTLNQIEEKYGKHSFPRMRSGMKQAATALIILFVLAILLVVVKPLAASTNWQQSLFNGAALFILLWNVLLLVSLTHGVFAIKADIGAASRP